MKIENFRQPLPAAEIIREALDYNPETGVFVWKSMTPARRKFYGKRAGTVNAHGYRVIKFDGSDYYEHRLAFVYCHGDVLDPETDIDHINCERADNRIANLRMATRTENIANWSGRPRPKHNLPRGVVADGSKYRASIRVRHKRYHLGNYDTPAEAHAAYLAAAKRHYGEFARAG